MAAFAQTVPLDTAGGRFVPEKKSCFLIVPAVLTKEAVGG
jgi:hypothetical protein